MPRRQLNSALMAALVFFSLSQTVRPAIASTMDQAWEKAASLLTSEAYEDFEQILKSGKSPREAGLGVALMLLNKQPKTDGNLDRAAEIFEQVSASGDDDIGMLAGYYRARIEQFHRRALDPAKAIDLFSKLIERNPGHPVAQYAVVKRAMMEIYDDSPVEAKRQRVAGLEESVERMSYPPAKRDLHLLIADTYVRLFPDDARTLKHLLAADAIGITRTKPKADVWVRIAELARLLGDRKTAGTYYRKYLKEFQRDNRHYTIEERLKELEQKGAGE